MLNTNGREMEPAIKLNIRDLVNELRKLPRKDKVFLAEKLEEELLSEWDSYEESPETVKRVSEAMDGLALNKINPL